ncbi:ZYRO0G02244p [Zygosaccharomyces rouxii]|uniref:ZYRO0G02244p n=1 Tax=Zygosaccharomyces rouxii (strain ATCC 2623 / CBS 732 / NBRC 1130 / NCYC 568 / NRRL Y-229) TaxID=559307 RepID=C5DZ84_ZYGRC|nr:uncharacterized protein ZYRO0G02244g [Zygosaccharomyces rouxii]KAH9202165.1 P-loop containing nucleoside triphosphate hydrolase protein [Zygosaccharomyces rouxii]CAR29168.1 ZYRO0G02244p [Zygosaccharomyces rouxii]
MGFHNNIYSYLQGKKDVILLGFVSASTIASGLVPAALSILTGRVFNLLNEYTQWSDPIHELRLRSMVILALGAGSIVIIWICISSWMLLGERQNFRVRTQLIDSYLQKPMKWYDDNDTLTGDLTQTNRCVEELRSSSAEASALTWKNLVTILALTVTSFYYSWSLTLVTMCGAPVIVLCAIFFSRLIHIYSEKENSHTAISSQLLSWSMEAAQLVRLSCMQLVEVQNFQLAVKKCSKNFMKMCLYASANTAILKFLTLTIFVQAFWFGSTMIRKHKLRIEDVITCFQSCVLLGATINGTLHQIVILQKGKVGVINVNEFLKKDEYLKEDFKNNRRFYLDGGISEKIELRNVQFNYPSRPTVPALKNVSLTLPVGKITYVVGKSGSGKSSLGNLLLKLYDDYNGSISIDGIDIKGIDQKSILKNITLVEQRCTLFNDTLRNNILFGSKETDELVRDESLKAACRISLLDNFIYDLPEGLDTLIGTGGITPSGGQQQRIAIARAYMRDTPILVLDEAVSALDIIHRGLLMNAIRNWRSEKTTIILTHDLSEIGPDDMIYLLEDGEVVEQGQQRNLLLNQQGRFFNMVSLGAGTDLADSSSLITTIEIPGRFKTSTYEDSLIEYELNTPRIDEDSGSLMEICSIPLDDFSHRQKDRSKAPRVTIQEKLNEKDLSSDEKGSEKDRSQDLMSILEIMKRMYSSSSRKGVLYLGIVCSLYAGISNPIFSYTFSYLLNGIVPDGNSDRGSSGYLLKWAFIVMGIAAADSGLTLLKEFILGYHSEIYIRTLRDDAMRKITYNRIEWLTQDNNKPSELSALLMNDLRDLRTSTSNFISFVSSFVIVSSVGLIWAIVTGWKLSLVCISMFPLLVIFSMIYGILLKKYETEYKNTIAKLENVQYEVVTGMKTIRCLQIEDHFKAKFNVLKQTAKLMGQRRAIVTGFGVAVSNGLTMSIQGILYYYAIKLVIHGEYTTKKMFETFTLLLFTIMTCNNLVNQIPDIRRGQRAASKIYRILEGIDESECFETEGHRIVPIVENPTGPIIRFNDLSFAYPTAPTVKILKHLSMEIYSGDRIAIVGESGCGKSTLVNIITRLYECPSNSLFVDNTDVNDWALPKLREQIAVVEQKPTLFKGTIRENLVYGSPLGTADVDVFNMLKYVGIYDFFATLPEGLETKIDSGLLSGGQNQRLCIARALLQRPKILILDECTSALDTMSSHIINEIIREGPPTMLTISITHDEQMVRACNKVAVLDQGHIVEMGNREDLLRQKGQLWKLVTRIGD